MHEQIAITLTRDDWIDLSDFLSRKVGETVNPLPTMNLLQALSVTDRTIMKELDDRQKRRYGRCAAGQ